MKRDKVIDFLSAIVAYDTRTIGEANVAAWTETAERGRWTLDEALDALHEHYRQTSDYVMPSHIEFHIRRSRRDAHERDVAARLTTPSSASSTAAAQAELEAIHRQAVALPCERCGQPAGARCLGPDGQPARIPHLARMRSHA